MGALVSDNEKITAEQAETLRRCRMWDQPDGEHQNLQSTQTIGPCEKERIIEVEIEYACAAFGNPEAPDFVGAGERHARDRQGYSTQPFFASS